MLRYLQQTTAVGWSKRAGTRTLGVDKDTPTFALSHFRQRGMFLLARTCFFLFFAFFCVVLGPSAFPSVAIFFAWTEAAYLWLCFLTFLPIVCFWFDCWQCSVLTFNEMSTKDAAYMSVCLSVLLSVRFTRNRRLSWHFPASFSVWLNALSPILRNELPAAFLG